MLNIYEVAETNKMIEKENLDVRTITLGISLLDCIDSDLDKLNEKIYNKIYEAAKNLVATGEDIAREFGIPIVNKRISVTPVSLIGGNLSPDGYIRLAKTLERAASDLGVNFLGGFSALVEKGMTKGAENMTFTNIGKMSAQGWGLWLYLRGLADCGPELPPVMGNRDIHWQDLNTWPGPSCSTNPQ